MNEIALKKEDESVLQDFEFCSQMAVKLLNTPHYKKMGEAGIFAVIQQAKAVGVNPLEALNGGMYFVNGAVEMRANLMNSLIRSKGHSIIKDESSNDKVCILHGKRADNGDTWTVSFSLKDAERAGLLYKEVWKRHPVAMLFARALSLLARQLFADVIKNCYVEGEISDSEPFSKKIAPDLEVEEIETIEDKFISKEQIDGLNEILDKDEEYKNRLLGFLKDHHKVESLDKVTLSLYDKIMEKIEAKYNLKESSNVENS